MSYFLSEFTADISVGSTDASDDLFVAIRVRDILDDTYLRKNGRQCGMDGVIMARDHSIGVQRAMKKILSVISASSQSANCLQVGSGFGFID